MTSQPQINANRLNSQKGPGNLSVRSRMPDPSRPPGLSPRPPNQHPPIKLNQLPHKLASFRQSPLHSGYSPA
jgi:hypothetical protein